jgi:hypothetical protein
MIPGQGSDWKPTYGWLAGMIGNMVGALRPALSPYGRRNVPEALFRKTTIDDEIQRCKGWLDHGHLWVGSLDGKRRVPIAFTSEPYGLNGEQTEELMDYAGEHGLNVHFDARSPHNPGETILVILTRKAPPR